METTQAVIDTLKGLIEDYRTVKQPENLQLVQQGIDAALALLVRVAVHEHIHRVNRTLEQQLIEHDDMAAHHKEVEEIRKFMAGEASKWKPE